MNAGARSASSLLVECGESPSVHDDDVTLVFVEEAKDAEIAQMRQRP
jgi:hypothetical protein